ncbi:MAG: DNA polymerase III subunit delta' [Gammaproteobacteria bacterium]|nr:DNA polymerase III subunit delta' [Gammaproteobacteria bacterium]
MNSPYPWQATEWAQLQARAAQRRLPHALLVTGPAGVGKRVFADAFARSLLCKRPMGDGADNSTACGGCEACLLLRAGTHPDYLTVTFIEDKTQIGIDQIRELCRALSLKSHAGGYKIAILTPAERMTVEAANSLLKTLEEPTDNTLLILVTEQPARLAATIRSRCQLLRFPAPPLEMGSTWLAAQIGDQDSSRNAGLLMRLSDAAPLRALALAHDNSVAQRRDWLEQIIAVRRGQQSPIAVAAAWNDDAQMRPLYWFGSYLMDLMRLEYGGFEYIKNIDLTDLLKVIADGMSSRDLHSLLERVGQTQQLAQQAGMNRQLLLEELLTEWSRVGQTRRVRA